MRNATEIEARSAESREQILGITFFRGSVEQAVAEMSHHGGLLVAPSGTCFERFLEDEEYRHAITSADVVLPDSGLMVALWRLLRGRHLNRISGLTYLKQLFAATNGRRTCWVLPHERSRAMLLQWPATSGRKITIDDSYIAPMYGKDVRDETLLAFIELRKPQDIIIAIGAGAQEKLGWYLRDRLGYRPAIHCVGGALGFITGDQTAISDWADRHYLGWFLRLLAQPRIFVPRLWKARLLPSLLFEYGEHLPPLRSKAVK